MNELDNLVVLFLRLTLLDQVDLVLHDDDVFQLHDLDGGQMFRCLRLRTRLVTRCTQSLRQHMMSNATISAVSFHITRVSMFWFCIIVWTTVHLDDGALGGQLNSYIQL